MSQPFSRGRGLGTSTKTFRSRLRAVYDRLKERLSVHRRRHGRRLVLKHADNLCALLVGRDSEAEGQVGGVICTPVPPPRRVVKMKPTPAWRPLLRQPAPLAGRRIWTFHAEARRESISERPGQTCDGEARDDPWPADHRRQAVKDPLVGACVFVSSCDQRRGRAGVLPGAP